MSKNRSHHTDPEYIRLAAIVRAAANADPTTRCRRCGLTRAEALDLWGERRAAWQAGHIVDGNLAAGLAPEHAKWNASAGATAGNAAREPHTERW